MKPYHVTITTDDGTCSTETVQVVESTSTVSAILNVLDRYYGAADDARLTIRARLADSITAHECLSDCDRCRCADAAGELAR